MGRKKKRASTVVSDQVIPEWQRHVIAVNKPWRSTFVFAFDIDGDGMPDIISGDKWYRNPGALSGEWSGYSLGHNVNNVAAVFDVDGDGDLDIFASTWNNPRRWTFIERLLRKIGVRSYYQKGELIWAENLGKGHFKAHDNIEPGHGDFLQGVGLIESQNKRMLLLSWHNQAESIDRVIIPSRPLNKVWPVNSLSVVSQDEALSVGDIDLDGDDDVVQGTMWLRHENNGGLTQFSLFDTDRKPDRNVIADINNDGYPDVVVGYEAVSSLGSVVWYEGSDQPTGYWREHVVANVIGPMSIDAGDIDRDGDVDIVVGEHDLVFPESARLLWYENLDQRGGQWHRHVVYTGDEHHDGAQLVDIDNDGDLDIVSIGWGHDQLIVYENTSVGQSRLK